MIIKANKHYHLTILLVISFIYLINAQKRYECNRRSYKHIDDLSAKLMTFGNSGRRFPTQQSEVPKFCNETKSLMITFDDVNKRCLKGLPKQVLSVGIYSIKVVMKQLCRKSSKRLELLLDAAHCANDGKRELEKCFTKTIDNLLGIQHANDSDKIAMACCQYTEMKSCGTAIAPKIRTCDQKKVEVIIDFVDSIAGNALNLVCGQYADSGTDMCDKFVIPKKRKNQRRSKSIFLPMIDLFESFPEV